mmetsp:Transcript_23875/g.34925  ORF Transcript_23875/g.34925 Transcript_23875/m.34925 type:complete len:139 (-) Transcript_23875:198-614(-)|eukprot:CAMPEP_0195518110 /NCGR_PEP_ID=MMETSP0794_2-20130614/12275_1 /TAXON_ID=515487 /ORGANISM="Stephanopyxis turris, Strain CCMP 815" /LENGTH=138 /DNA_ID=CAMNT_0040647025 /DNA_START=49 /DNA_END=465 /DNA_ORIENTATION=+
MSDDKVIIRSKKLIKNHLLKRRQFVIEVIHPGKANVSKADLTTQVQSVYECDPQTIVLFGFRNKFGGGRSTGFCLIYDSLEALKKFEPKHRQIRAGLIKKKETSRKQIKEQKNRMKKVWGLGRRVIKKKARRAAAMED